MAVLKTDAFTGANGTLIPTYDANWVTQAGGDLEIQSNAVANDTTGTAVARYNGVTWPDDQYVQATVVAVALHVQGVSARIPAGGGVVTYYGAGHNNSEYGHSRYAIWSYKGGAFTNHDAHGSQAVTIGDVVTLKVITTGGNAILSLYVNDPTMAGSPLLGPITDSSSPLTSGQAGLSLFHGTAGVALWDTFVGGDFVSAVTPLGMFGGN